MFPYVSIDDWGADHLIHKLRVLVGATLGELDELLAALCCGQCQLADSLGTGFLAVIP
jgi:hypothetical protein